MGYISHKDVIKEQRKSRLLLLMINNTPNSKGIVTGKVLSIWLQKTNFSYWS